MNKKILLTVAGVVLVAAMLACSTSTFLPTAPGAVATQAAGGNVPITSQSATLQPQSAPDLVNQQDKLVSLYQNVTPGIVTILTSNALGSGWVYSTDGYIVTNQHVVANETKVEVDFTNGNKVYGNVIGADANSDLAVIKVDLPADQLHPLPLGDSDKLQVGQVAVALGDPLALNGTTLTSGVIAGLGRSEDSNNPTQGGYYAAGDFIETDALLNHGNSGGPLLDLNGQVIGVNRSIQIDQSTGIPSGLGYAISVNVVKRVVPQLIQNGKFDYPYLGASFFPGGLTLDMINTLGLKSTTGAYVTNVVPGGPADKAGLKAASTQSNSQGQSLGAGGDLIVGVDGKPVMEFNDLMRYIIVNKAPGDTVTLSVLRGDQKVDVPLTLGARP
jgi:S1-C subfamily serine protease